MLRRHIRRYTFRCRGRQFLSIGWISGILAAVLLVSFLSALNARIKPILTAMATTRVSNAVTAAMNNAVSNGVVAKEIVYRDIVTLETNTSGQITALTSNLEQVNLLRSELVALVLEDVSRLSTEDFSIPVGSLTGIDLLSGRGPTITVRVHSAGAANASFEHNFISAGVNQTLHQILLVIAVDVQVLLPGQTIELPVSTQVCVAETVIVGEVPDTYLEWEH